MVGGCLRQTSDFIRNLLQTSRNSSEPSSSPATISLSVASPTRTHSIRWASLMSAHAETLTAEFDISSRVYSFPLIFQETSLNPNSRLSPRLEFPIVHFP